MCSYIFLPVRLKYIIVSLYLCILASEDLFTVPTCDDRLVFFLSVHANLKTYFHIKHCPHS